MPLYIRLGNRVKTCIKKIIIIEREREQGPKIYRASTMLGTVLSMLTCLHVSSLKLREMK